MNKDALPRGNDGATNGNKPEKEARTFMALYYAHTAELPEGKQTAISERVASPQALSSSLKSFPREVAYAR
jgi:hypothetical protein